MYMRPNFWKFLYDNLEIREIGQYIWKSRHLYNLSIVVKLMFFSNIFIIKQTLFFISSIQNYNQYYEWLILSINCLGSYIS